MNVEAAAYALWAAFFVTWYAAMLWTARATVRAPFSTRLGYLLGFVLGFELLFTPPNDVALFGHPIIGLGFVAPGLARALWRAPAAANWGLLGLEAAAFAFAWWARIHIGALWSGMLTLREGHRVVDTGPYRLVRHPIYTGYIGACWMLALIVAAPATLAGALVLTLVMTVKAKEEERFLRQELGPASYDVYAAKTPMLIPFSPI